MANTKLTQYARFWKEAEQRVDDYQEERDILTQRFIEYMRHLSTINELAARMPRELAILSIQTVFNVLQATPQELPGVRRF